MPTFVPVSRTQTNFRSLVLGYVQADNLSDSELTAVADEALDSATGRINSRNWHKILGNATATLVADQISYTFASGFSSVISDVRDPIALMKRDTNANRSGRIAYKAFKSMLVEHPSAGTSGTVSVYSMDYQNRQLTFDRAPDAAFVASYPSVDFWYHRRIAELSGTSDDMDVPPDFDWYIVWHARMEVAEHLGFDRKADRALQMMERQWQALTRDDNEVETDWSEW